MTSEPSHYGWPGDSSQPDDEPASPRGFGLFDSPPVPPSSSFRSDFGSDFRSDDSRPGEFRSDDVLSDDFRSGGSRSEFRSELGSDFGSDFRSDSYRSDGDSSLSSSFSGFPSDDPLTGDLPAHYVPAPAAMPIPGVRHDPEPVSPSPSWADSIARSPLDAASGSLDAEEPSSPPSASWAAFAAGAAKPAPAATDWRSPAPAAGSAGPSSDWNQFGTPAAPAALPPPAPEPQRAAGSARVAASVSVPNLIAPDDTPMPPELPKQPGRVYGSAAVAAPESGAPAAPPPPGAPAGMAPVSPGHPTPAARATARASIPVARPEPGDAPPPATRSSTVYGSSTGAAVAPGQAPPPPGMPNQAPQWQSRPHAFGDLLAPANPAAGMPAGAAQAMPQTESPYTDAPYTDAPYPESPYPESPSIPGQRAGDSQGHFAPAQPMGMPPGARTGGPMAPPRGPMAPQAPADEPKPERKGRIVVGVLVICVALLAAAFGGLILVDKLVNGATFAVGDCVKQSDAAAVKADCGETGAFKVIASVSNPEQCQDQTQPHVQQGSVVYCLAPAAAGGNDAGATTNPAAGGTPTPGASATK